MYSGGVSLACKYIYDTLTVYTSEWNSPNNVVFARVYPGYLTHGWSVYPTKHGHTWQCMLDWTPVCVPWQGTSPHCHPQGYKQTRDGCENMH